VSREPVVKDDDYDLDAQIGFRLRLAMQRHTAIFFAHMIPNLTQTQFAVLVRLWERGSTSQNELGRLAAIDSATIWGVVQRLQSGGLVETETNPDDRRRLTVSLTECGRATVEEAIARARVSNEETLAPLSVAERLTLTRLLRKLGQ
jgi:DNA-binding MarR family transcriptional regulator